MSTLPFQPAHRSPLPHVLGLADYLAQHRLFERIDAILAQRNWATKNGANKVLVSHEGAKADGVMRTIFAMFALHTNNITKAFSDPLCGEILDAACES